MTYENSILWVKKEIKEILAEKGYIRGPFGSSLRRHELKSSGIPVYEQQHAIYNSREFRLFIDENKFNELKRFQVKTGDILISCSGTIGKISIIREEDPKGIISQALLILRPNPNVVQPLFLKYFLESPAGFNSIVSRSSGSVQVNIAKRELIENIELPIPSLKEQDVIINILNSIESNIKTNQQMNITLESIAQALFKHWFIDFEFPDENGQPYESSGGEMVDSEIGEIPKNWTIKKLDEIANFLNGLPLQKYPAINDDDYLPVIKIREMNSRISGTSDKASRDIPSEYIVDNGEVIFAWSGSLGVTIWCNGRGALNQHLFKVSSKDYPKWFYYQCLPSYFLLLLIPLYLLPFQQHCTGGMLPISLLYA